MLAKKMFFLNSRKFMLAKKNQKTFFSKLRVFSGIVFFKTKTSRYKQIQTKFNQSIWVASVTSFVFFLSLHRFGFLGYDKAGQNIVLIPNCVVRFLGGFFVFKNSFLIRIFNLFLLDDKKTRRFQWCL